MKGGLKCSTTGCGGRYVMMGLTRMLLMYSVDTSVTSKYKFDLIL